MDDVRYIATHPLLQRIMVRCAELAEQASQLVDGARQRQELERRISVLEQYGLPKATDADRWRLRPIQNEAGDVILPGGRSLRERFKPRRGNPDRHRVAVRAALEQKSRDPQKTWQTLAEKYGFNLWDLQRQVNLFRNTLKREGIQVPSEQECVDAEDRFAEACAGFERARRRDDSLFSPTTILSRYRQGILTPEMAAPTGPGFSSR